MEKKPISIDDLFLLKNIINVKILPGKEFLFEEQKMNEKENKYFSAIYKYNNEGNINQFSSGLSQDKSMKLSPDKSKIAFLSSRGKEDAKPQIFIMSVDGGEAIRYTKVPNGVNEFSWSLDGTKIAFTHRVNLEEQDEEDEENEEKKKRNDIELKVEKLKKDEKEKKKIDPRIIKKIVYRKGTAFLDDKYSQVYVLKLEDKEVTRVTKGVYNYLSPVLSEKQDKIYALLHKEKGSLNDLYEFSLLEINLETKEEKELKVIYGFGSGLKLSPNGQWLAFTESVNPELISTQNSDIKILNLSTGLEKWVSKEIDNNAHSPIFDNKSNYVYFISDEWEKEVVNRYNIDRESLEKLYLGESFVQSFDVDSEQGLILLNVSTKVDSSSLVLYDYVYKDTKILRSSNHKWLEDKLLSSTEEIRYKGYNEKEIQGWIVKPPDFDDNKKYPLILNIHGGPHATWSPYERSMWFEFQYFASQGYVVFYCNPQGSSGRGFDFRYVIENWGTEPEQDILKGVDEVIKKGYIDENNLFITGGSYGGYMTSWIVGHDNRFSAAAPQRGVYNLVSFWSVTDVTQFTKDEIGAFPWEDLNKMWDLSPIAYVDKTKTPSRIIHSELDFRVPISQAEEYFASLVKLGVEAELIRYPEEGHELSRSGKPKHMKDRLEKIVEWFNNHQK